MSTLDPDAPKLLIPVGDRAITFVDADEYGYWQWNDGSKIQMNGGRSIRRRATTFIRQMLEGDNYMARSSDKKADALRMSRIASDLRTFMRAYSLPEVFHNVQNVGYCLDPAFVRTGPSYGIKWIREAIEHVKRQQQIQVQAFPGDGKETFGNVLRRQLESTHRVIFIDVSSGESDLYGLLGRHASPDGFSCRQPEVAEWLRQKETVIFIDGLAEYQRQNEFAFLSLVYSIKNLAASCGYPRVVTVPLLPNLISHLLPRGIGSSTWQSFHPLAGDLTRMREWAVQALSDGRVVASESDLSEIWNATGGRLYAVEQAVEVSQLGSGKDAILTAIQVAHRTQAAAVFESLGKCCQDYLTSDSDDARCKAELVRLRILDPHGSTIAVPEWRDAWLAMRDSAV